MKTPARADAHEGANDGLEAEPPPFALHSTLPPEAFDQMQRIAIACLLGVTVAVFAQGLFGTFVSDDVALIVQNRYVREAHDLLSALISPFWHVSSRATPEVAYYRPLITLSYVLEWKLHGDRPFGYHLTNLLVHLACVALVFRWLRARLSSGTCAERDWKTLAGAMAGALLFAIHPSRVEVVSWISGRADALMALFALSGLWWFARNRGPLRGVVTGVGFALALLCKEAVVALPFCLLLDVALREAAEPRRAALRQAWIALGITATAALLRFALLPATVNVHDLLTQPVERVLASIGHYALCVVWPAEPSTLTALQVRDGAGRVVYSHAAIALGAGCVLALLGLALLARKHVRARPWLADALWVSIALLPALNLVPLNLKPLVANRFLYLPMLGVSALVARALTAALQRRGARSFFTLAGQIAMLIACAVGSIRCMPAFANDQALTAYEHRLHPKDTRTLERLALDVARRGESRAALQIALDGYNAADEQHDPAARVRFLLLAARFLGDGLRDAQKTELQALAEFYDALERGDIAQLEVPPLRVAFSLGARGRAELTSEIEHFVVPRALLRARLAQTDAAIASLWRATHDNPEAAVAYRALALLLSRKEHHEDAMAALRRAEAASPAHGETLALRKRILDAHALFTLPATDIDAAAVARAQALLVLAAPLAALAAIESALATMPDDALLIATAARIETLAGDPAAARARIAAAKERLPQAHNRLDAVTHEIAAFERGERPEPPR